MAARSTAIRDKDRAVIARGRPPCALCGRPIDYSIRYPDAWCFVVDHIVPLNCGGLDVLANKQAAHNKCNRLKSDSVDGGPVLKRSASLAN